MRIFQVFLVGVDLWGALSDHSASDACSSHVASHHASISSLSTNSTNVPSTHLSTVIANPTISAVSAVTLQSNSAMSTNSTPQPQTSRTPTGSPAGSVLGSHSTPQSSTDARIYGFDLNEHWQSDKDYYDNPKINGLTLPRTIRSSAFTQKLDIEGCDPLSLPLAALLYPQANNHWIRKPTGDLASVVFMTELLKQFLTRGIDLDRVDDQSETRWETHG